MKAQRLTSQGSITRMMQSAAEAWNRLDYTQSIELMERASKLDPANTGLLLDLGRAYGMRYDCAAAERCFEKAAQLSPRKAEVLAMAGTQCRGFNRYEMARHYFERAIAEPGSPPDDLVKLAELYERFHFLKEASELVDRALAADSQCALAVLVRARLDRLSGRAEAAEKTLRPLLARTDNDTWSTRVRGWYELGAILDRQGRYDEAMEAFHRAKEMIRPNAVQRLAEQHKVQASLKLAETEITADILKRWHETGADLQPTRRIALLGGHPRSGTTLLEQVLDSHPDVVSAEETAIFFHEGYLPLRKGFREDAPILLGLQSASTDQLRKLRGNYFHCLDLFRGEAIGDRLLIDKNPSLTALVPAVARIFPEARFLIALRDPRDVCLSCFMQPLPLNQVSSAFLTLGDTIQEYASLMGHWQTIGPRLANPRLEIRYEDVVADLKPQARRVLEFLNVPWDDRVLRFHEHAQQKLVRSPTYADVAKPVFKGAIGRWRNYQKHLEPWLDKLAPFAKAFGYE